MEVLRTAVSAFVHDPEKNSNEHDPTSQIVPTDLARCDDLAARPYRKGRSRSSINRSPRGKLRLDADREKPLPQPRSL